MNRTSRGEILSWINAKPPLHELMRRFPADWDVVGREFVSVLEGSTAGRLSDYARNAKSAYELWNGRIRKGRVTSSAIETALPHLVRNKMRLLAIDQCCLAAATGKASGRIRFNRINGFVIQRLLFRRHLTRKPASLGWFRFWWPLLPQKRFLMPLVQPKGIYCFYSKSLIRELKTRLHSWETLEIGAGDGTLTEFLRQAGVRIHASDDHSWSHAIQYPGSVENLDAKKALQQFLPQAVICSWPPPGNSFERQVFATPSVREYIVIGSRYRFASGNWDAYSAQSSFEWSADEKLSSLILPPELDSSVLIFRRKA